MTIDAYMYERAVSVATRAILADPDYDWQSAQHALAGHPTLGPWLRSRGAPDDLAEVMAIITEAEQRTHETRDYNGL